MIPLIFGIDHGNGNIKTENNVFPCGLVKLATKPIRILSEDILEYNGSYYMLSDNRLPLKKDKSIDEDYFILTLFAICKEAELRNIQTLTGKDLVLSVGLPPADYNAQAESFKNYFLEKGKYGISLTFNNKKMNFKIVDCVSTLQNFAAITCFKSNLLIENNKVFCIDIGEGTVDLLIFKKGMPDLSVKVSNKNGLSILKTEIINRVQQDYNYDLEADDVEEILKTGESLLGEEVVSLIQKITEDWMNNVINELHAYVKDFRTNYTVFVGGGSIMLKNLIEKSEEFSRIEFIDDIKANAIGYARMAKIKYAS